jgi:hypothetical protein
VHRRISLDDRHISESEGIAHAQQDGLYLLSMFEATLSACARQRSHASTL